MDRKVVVPLTMFEGPVDAGQLRTQRWPLPCGADFRQSFFADIFERYWHRLTFGPIRPDRWSAPDGWGSELKTALVLP
ncbi:MAG TPA: hypothetical protein VNS79_14730 [Sphingobium sp.]|nr:hypothetical protein [Sphingobium sp.]